MTPTSADLLTLLEELIGSPCPPVSPSEYLTVAYYDGLLTYDEAKGIYLDLQAALGNQAKARGGEEGKP